MSGDDTVRSNRTFEAARTRAHLLAARFARARNRPDKADSSLEKAWQTSAEDDASTALKFGNMALRKGDNSSAIAAFTKAVEAEPSNSTALYKLGFALERSGDFLEAEETYAIAQELSPAAGNIAFRRGRCLAELGANDDAITQYHTAIRQEYQVAEAYEAIYKCERHSPLWKRLETLRAGTSYRLDDAVWLRDRAVFAAKMGSYDEAVEFFAKSDEIVPLPRNHRISMAQAFHALGRTERAAELLDELAAKDDGPAKVLGPGVFFKELGHWSEAIALFERKRDETADSRLRATLEFEIGHAFDRQYQWEHARKWFNRSLVSDGEKPYRHYRLGVVLERLGEFRDALGPYAHATQLEPNKPHWWYRLASAARKADNIEVSLSAFDSSLNSGSVLAGSEDTSSGSGDHENETTENATIRELALEHAKALHSARRTERSADAQTWKEAVALARKAGNESDALYALQQLRLRTSHLDSDETTALAGLLVQNGEPNDAIAVFEATRDVRFPDGLDLKKYLTKPASRRRSLFAEFLETLPLAETTVLLESNHGSSIGCHPLALFREMSVDDRFNGFTYVWVHTSDARVPHEIRRRSNVVLVEIHSDLYLKYLASAKYLINNVSFAPYFVRREGQVYLNTWHGTPLKTLGQSMRQGTLEFENLARNFVQATHVSSPNELTDWALFEDHRISRYASAERRVTGSPRLDRLINSGDALRQEIRSVLNIREEETLVLYAPTWRGGVSDHDFDIDRLRSDLEALASVPGARVFFRAHRLTEKLVAGELLPVDVVPAEIDTNDLLAGVDVLVTDYSSIAFDFLPTKRPIIFYVPDLEEYMNSRGLYLLPEEVLGSVCRDRMTLVSAVESAGSGNAEDLENAIERFAPKEDGRASQRVLDFMLETPKGRTSERPLIVIHASLIPNGIASALLALLYALNPDDVDIVLVVEGHVMRREETRRAILERIPEYVDLAFRVGDMSATPEEQWAINRDRTHDVGNSLSLKMLQRRAWHRDARRALGAVEPRSAIEFDGYATLWADFIANVGGTRTRHLIWQHNQLVDEWRTKYPELAQLFSRYADFDTIVPVASALATENKTALASAGFDSSQPYSPVPNVLDSDRIVTSAEKVLDEDLDDWLDSDCQNIVSIGRLSPEKNFNSLIEAWPMVLEHHPKARLTIIGSGLLEADLKARVRELGISGSVFMAGQRKNPYPALKRADLFVLPSTHEGQPVVVQEAMTLGVPVAAAYTPGTAELIDNGYGFIVRATAHGLGEDLVRLLRDPSASQGSIDSNAVREKSLKAFLKLAVSE
ncbi:CDP-glycerol glycerophosphotransferase family protein [Brevibacterium casei]|uniref:CDP-glycerol glycerophosphotransferase family protein n=1 Tax=Brevibacterium casei TaxID=33889 RepID=A0A7T4A193_9MICO|nr:CDP-glycerol glycerophosphotransferase family protein [Brevibacterium casei]QQB15451.1 CDP-glycerol glycerophosphotransferase family protein [Brevibacterium casei]